MSTQVAELEKLSEYKYGFSDNVKYTYQTGRGLDAGVVRELSSIKGEPQWMLDFRLKALEIFNKKPMPTWGGQINLNLDEITYYTRPSEKTESNWDDVPADIKNTFDKLGIPEAERKFLAGVGAQYESEMVYHSVQKHLEELGVIFLSSDDGLRQYPDLFREHFGKVIPPTDNKFAACNSAVWSGGSFVYVPKGVKVEMPLQAYFRLNAEGTGQFERTLIIVDEGAQVHYVEGCFLAGARVRTRAGEKPIEQIVVGDEVLTHQGRYRSVYHTMNRPYRGDVYSIRFFGDSDRQLQVTDDHPLLVVRRKRQNERNKEFNLVWTTASTVKVGDYLAIPVPQPEMELAYAGVTVANRPRQNGQTLVLSSTEAARAFTREFGANVYEKHVPEWVLSAPLDLLAELVRGMWCGDGSYDARKNMFRYNTVSANLAYSFRDALLRLGIPASVNLQNRAEPRQDLYTVVISSPANSRFGEIVGVDAKDGDLSGSPFQLDENFLYVPIREISKAKQETDVYNFSVEEDESYVCEGVVSHNCTAPTYSRDSFHSGVIEIIVKKGARMRYTTIQNWSTNVYNLVTQRAVVHAGATMEWVDANLGSKLTMKYPSCYLVGEGAHGEILSMAFAGPGQHQDTGGKVVHGAPNTTSKITSKSISHGGGRASYRGLLKVYKGAAGAKSSVVCDALLIDDKSRSDTYPVIEIDEDDVTIGHEASVSKVGEEQLFYLMSRGIAKDQAEGLVVAGFIEPLVKELPMEYAVELNRLVQLKMEGSVG